LWLSQHFNFRTIIMNLINSCAYILLMVYLKMSDIALRAHLNKELREYTSV
jgi:spore coat protein CotF